MGDGMGVSEIQGAVAAVLSFIGGTGIISGLLLRRLDKLEKKLDSQEDARVEERGQKVLIK